MRPFVLGFFAFVMASGSTAFTRHESGRPIRTLMEEIIVASEARPTGEGGNESRECAATKAIVTPELNVQVYRLAARGGELEVAAGQEVIIHSHSGDVVRFGTTDRDGFVRFTGLGPADYTLHIPTGLLEPLYQRVQLTRGNAGFGRTIAALSNITCGRACVVDGIRGPLQSPPSCLFRTGP